MKYTSLLFCFALLAAVPVTAQQSTLIPQVRQAVYFDVSPPLREMYQMDPVKLPGGLSEVPNKVGHRELNGLKSNGIPYAEDKVWQKQDGTRLPIYATTLTDWEGINNLSGVYPPDTQGDVGPNHYVQVVNLKFSIWSKTGTQILAPANLSTIWAGIPSPWNGTNNGDPVVLYDQAADRWLITQFSLPSTTQYAELVAISQTSDPTGAWYRYVFEYGSKMPDYPKLGVWPDAYYMSVNQFEGGAAWAGAGASAFDRTKMLAGDPTASMVYFDLGANSDPGGMLPSDWDGVTPPVAGEPNYFIYYNDWTSDTTDYLKVWEFHVDWTTPANSTFMETYSLIPSPFDSEICSAYRGRCIPQPGTTVKLESLSDRLMYRLQYRNFGTHRSMVTNHSVDVDGSGRAGVRWYELRNNGAGWSIYQQGTWSPDNLNRWMGSIALNGNGDIALGYSVSASSSVYPSIRYTGRLANDTPGLMTFPEQTVIAGSGYQSGSSARWGDYSMMSVDPTNDHTFWYTTEYIQTTGSTSWRTRITSFELASVPSVATMEATGVTMTSATLNGNISPNGLPTDYHFEWGATTAYGNATPVTGAGSGNTLNPVSEDLTGLTTSQIYHFRLVGINSAGTTYGMDKTVSPGLARVGTTPVTSVTPASAATGGTVYSDGGAAVTERGICWGTTASPSIAGNHTAYGAGPGTFVSPLTGLTPNTTYYVRAYATNATATTYGEELTFKTPCVSVTSFPWTEGFEMGGVSACWTQIQVDASGLSWLFFTGNGGSNPATAHTGSWNACLKDASSADNKTKLVTPPLDLTGVVSPQLKFWHTQEAVSSRQDQLEIYYKTSPNANWIFLASYTSSVVSWTQRTLTLPNPSSTYYIAFQGNAKNGRGVCVDDVEVSSSCTTTYPVSVSITAGANPVTSGTSVAFTAVPVNGGTTPAYQWKVNGANAGTTNPYTYAPSNDDEVVCVLTSNASCITGNPAVSNTITMSVWNIPMNLTLTGVNVSLSQCFDAFQTITTGGDGNSFTVQPGGSATLIAGQNILLTPETSVLPGGYLAGYILPAGPFCSPTDQPDVARISGSNRTAGAGILSVYPNPTTGSFVIELQQKETNPGRTVEVYDMKGQCVLSSILDDTGHLRLSLAGKPAGIYLVRLAGAGEAGTARIILQK